MEDPIEMREQRIGTGGGTIVREEQTTAPPAATRPQPAVVPSASGYSQTRVAVYPVAYRATQLVWLAVGVIDIILALDFLFRALRANDTGFANFIYGLGGALAAPFDGIFGNTVNNATLGIDRWGDLMAILIYSLVGYLITKLIRVAATPKDVAAPRPMV